MATRNLKKLADLIQQHQDEIMQLWRAKVRHVPAARRLNQIALDDHIRVLLKDIVEALSRAQRQSLIKMPFDGAAAEHGIERLRQNFNLVEVVAEYNALRDVIQ